MAELRVRYAAALFDLSMESGNLNEFLDQAVFLRNALQDDECMRVIAHPHISAADKRAFLSNAFAESIHNDLLGFLYLLISKNRERVLIPALTTFIDMADRHYGKTVANVVSANVLNEGQISELKELLSKKLNKRVEVSLKVDPSVIGGFFVHVDGYFIDRTIKKHLHDMKATIKKEYGE